MQSKWLGYSARTYREQEWNYGEAVQVAGRLLHAAVLAVEMHQMRFHRVPRKLTNELFSFFTCTGDFKVVNTHSLSLIWCSLPSAAPYAPQWKCICEKVKLLPRGPPFRVGASPENSISTAKNFTFIFELVFRKKRSLLEWKIKITDALGENENDFCKNHEIAVFVLNFEFDYLRFWWS